MVNGNTQSFQADNASFLGNSSEEGRNDAKEAHCAKGNTAGML
jgi:hypothetical protein